MGLTGISPTRRTPGDLREFFFATGPGTASSARDVLIYGNKTSAGSETVEVIGTPILDLNDAALRLGRRSEAYHEYRLASAADVTSNYYVCVVAEGAGSAASVVVSFGAAVTDVATDTTTCTLEFQGESTGFTVATGDTMETVAANATAAWNAASDGTWMATAAQGTTTNAYKMTITGTQLGVRLNSLFSNSLRVTFGKDVGPDVSIGSVTAGATDDDFTNAYAAASMGEYFDQINPKYSTSAPSSSDGGVGEGILYLRTQNLPINGKLQRMHFGLTGTQAQATTVVTDDDANSVLAFFYHAEDSDWSAAMIAAHMCGIVHSQEQAHPSANLTGYHSSDKTIMLGPPDPHDKSDRPTAVEIELDLANGIVPIAYTSKGSPYIVRHINSYNVGPSSSKDYRASEGHTTSAIAYAWDLAKARWLAEKQPFCADDPPAGAKPTMATSTPSQLKALLNGVIDDLTSSSPLGLFNGPILSPSPADIQSMRDSIAVSKVPGGFNVAVAFKAVEHNLKSAWQIRQTNVAY